MSTGYKTNNIDVDEILEEIENAGLDIPKVQCSICGREKPAHGPCCIHIAGGLAPWETAGAIYAG